MKVDYIECGNCLDKIKGLEDNSVNIVLTSPPYNTGRNTKSECRYDVYLEKENEEYLDMTLTLFNEIDRVLAKDGVILYNMSYGNENSDILWLTINDIITKTNFSVVDNIIWKKSSAMPNSASPNRVTRITEFVFVICRKSESETFKMNKKVASIGSNSQKYYENIFNFIEAPNNDGACDLNKATYSTMLVTKLLEMYSTSEEDVVLDPFMGTGTTAVGCIEMGRHYIGFELSEKQVEYSLDRIKKAHKIITVCDGTKKVEMQSISLWD